jgi:hypothetical protein
LLRLGPSSFVLSLCSLSLFSLLPATALAHPPGHHSGAEASEEVAAQVSPSEIDVVAQLELVPGLRILEEQAPPSADYRFFVLSYTQLVDHLDPGSGTFEQIVTLLHRSTSAPTVAYTTGYDLPTYPILDEPTELVAGNQVSIEERFFASSTPDPADYSDLNIFQAASDHHAIIQALRPIYAGKWLSSGASKGGMATVYHRRFFDEDIDGSVVYVAPNDVVDDEDVYDEFLANVGTRECRDALIAVTRAALERRDEVVPVFEVLAAEIGYTFEYVGGPDAAYESAAGSVYWSFWQYWLEEDCASIPPPDAPLGELLSFVSTITGLLGANDLSALAYYAYNYQAATQLGSPDTSGWLTAIEDLLLYTYDAAEESTSEGGTGEAKGAELDDEAGAEDGEALIELDTSAMADIDRWVKTEGHDLIFIYGENDPWTAEPFELGPGTRDSAWYMVAGGNHSASIGDLPDAERLEATNRVRRWAGLPSLSSLPDIEADDAAADGDAANVAAVERALARAQRLALRRLPPPSALF